MTTTTDRKPRRQLVLLGALGTLIVLAAAAVYFGDVWRGKSVPAQAQVVEAISDEQLMTVDRTRVFFGHQSVGENILDGVGAVYEAKQLTPPPIAQHSTAPGPDGGFIVHEFIGENEHPVSKIEAFDKALRGGLGEQVDVALMKLCFLDINTSTDVAALFSKYRDTISGLQRDYPNINFVHVTVPLTIDSTIKNRIKIKLGGNDRYGQGENVARERYNELMRAEYGEAVFDLAAIESTNPDGARQTLHYDGQPYYAMYKGYASDLAHLNAEGSEVAARAFLQAIANASPR